MSDHLTLIDDTPKNVVIDPKMTIKEASKALGISIQAVTKKLKVNKLAYNKINGKIFFRHNTCKEIFNLSVKPTTISMEIVKGGVGKTTTTQALAIRLSLYGLKVLCIDLDQQANLTQCFYIDSEELPVMYDLINGQYGLSINDLVVPVCEGIDLIPSSIENSVLDQYLMLKSLPLDRVYKEHLNTIKKNYDIILIDCPPSLGQSVGAATLASDLVLSPVAPEKFCLAGLRVTTNEFKNIESSFKSKINHKIFINKLSSRTVLSKDIMSTLYQHPYYSERLFSSHVRESQEFKNAQKNNRTIYDVLSDSGPKEDIDCLARELIKEISIGRLSKNKSSSKKSRSPKKHKEAESI